jgi:predicted dehydrogenase
MNTKLRMGMIGGGRGAFIGPVHRIAANMDGVIELSCWAPSRNPENALESGRVGFLPEDRIYKTYQDMLEKESLLTDDKKIDFVTLVTPNFAHFGPAMMALDKGFHVVVEKPFIFSLEEAKQLKKKVEETGLLYFTYPYLCGLSNGKASP